MTATRPADDDPDDRPPAGGREPVRLSDAIREFAAALAERARTCTGEPRMPP